MKFDRYNLHQFYQGENSQSKYLNVQEYTDDVYNVEALQIVTLAMDLPTKTVKQRKEMEAKWIAVLPTLDNIKKLSIRHIVKQDFFDAICKMKNLEHLGFWTSRFEDLLNIKYLTNLEFLALDSFTRLKNISPLLDLKRLRKLAISNCFNVENYEIIGKMTQLVALSLSGNEFAPRNLMLKSLAPYEKLKNLKHLDLSSASVIDGSYESILKMTSLERFDTTANMPKAKQDLIKATHPNLRAGFFMDWDFDNKKLYDGKQW